MDFEVERIRRQDLWAVGDQRPALSDSKRAKRVEAESKGQLPAPSGAERSAPRIARLADR